MPDHELVVRRLRAAAATLRPGGTLKISNWDALELRLLTVPGLIERGFGEATAEEIVAAAQAGDFSPLGRTIRAVGIEVDDEMPNLICPQAYAPDAPFTRCRWPSGDLSGQRVEFRWTSGQESAAGVGTFVVRGLTFTDKVSIHVDQTLPGSAPDTFVHRSVPLYQRHVDAIERHPHAGEGNPPNPPFRMLA
ncbi:MAG: hypothetical protein INR62_03080 [Rhodospirillales bacterium]|nr:hypothetical protein [Acetobacter sp.]